MGLDIYFVYETDKDDVEVPEFACRGLQDLFEYPVGIEELQNSVLNPLFVQDFPKLSVWEPSDEEYEEIEEMMAEGLEPYVGPTFDAKELVAWAEAWIKIIPKLDIEEQGMVLPLATSGYDWMPDILKDLTEIKKQGECAQAHGVQMHIEMY